MAEIIHFLLHLKIHLLSRCTSINLKVIISECMKSPEILDNKTGAGYDLCLEHTFRIFSINIFESAKRTLICVVSQSSSWDVKAKKLKKNRKYPLYLICHCLTVMAYLEYNSVHLPRKTQIHSWTDSSASNQFG